MIDERAEITVWVLEPATGEVLDSFHPETFSLTESITSDTSWSCQVGRKGFLPDFTNGPPKQVAITANLPQIRINGSLTDQVFVLSMGWLLDQTLSNTGVVTLSGAGPEWFLKKTLVKQNSIYVDIVPYVALVSLYNPIANATTSPDNYRALPTGSVIPPLSTFAWLESDRITVYDALRQVMGTDEGFTFGWAYNPSYVSSGGTPFYTVPAGWGSTKNSVVTFQGGNDTNSNVKSFSLSKKGASYANEILGVRSTGAEAQVITRNNPGIDLTLSEWYSLPEYKDYTNAYNATGVRLNQTSTYSTSAQVTINGASASNGVRLWRIGDHIKTTLEADSRGLGESSNSTSLFDGWMRATGRTVTYNRDSWETTVDLVNSAVWGVS